VLQIGGPGFRQLIEARGYHPRDDKSRSPYSCRRDSQPTPVPRRDSSQ
jgi:hypothetical protein